MTMLGYQITLGDAVFECGKMRFSEEVVSLEEKIESIEDDDTLDVTLESHEDSIQKLSITDRNLSVSKI